MAVFHILDSKTKCCKAFYILMSNETVPAR